MNLVDELHDIARVLHDAGVPHAVCGGIAVTIHGATRTTKDIDVLVPPARVGEVLELVRALGYTFAALPMTFDVGTAKERRVQRVTKVVGPHHLILDLIHEDAAFAGFLRDRVHVDLPEGRVTVVSLETLARMKRLAGRPQDVADLMQLGLDPKLRDDA